MALLLLFVDGLGLAGRDNNPLHQAGVEALALFSDSIDTYSFAGGAAKAVDATLGIGGLPQSATGQTALFTGVNAARLIGRHLSGWPSPRLRTLLRSDSIFIRLKAGGRRVAFANAFTPGYFLRPVRLMSASTLHMLYAGLRPRWIWQIPSGEAVYQDFTNRMLIESGFDVPEHTPEQAGSNLRGLLEKFDFVLYEFFLTDAAAHRRIGIDTVEVIKRLERMLTTLIDSCGPRRHTLVLCSDHGNIEDDSTRGHTRNPVPLAAWGRGAEPILEEVRDITGIASAICRFVLD
jgi:2,3-bisphosphoglycerate-independent phosphoglycerate mutase